MLHTGFVHLMDQKDIPCWATFDVKLAKICAGKMLLRLFMLFDGNVDFPPDALLLLLFVTKFSFALCNTAFELTSFLSNNGLRSCCTAVQRIT